MAQKIYPNMLFGALLRGPFLYVPNVGAQPEPPVNFNSNVQALVGVLSPVTNAETPLSVNLNTYVLKSPLPPRRRPRSTSCSSTTSSPSTPIAAARTSSS